MRACFPGLGEAGELIQGTVAGQPLRNSCSALPIITIISRYSRSATMNSWCVTGRWTRSRPSKLQPHRHKAGRGLRMPVVATGDSHFFQEPEDWIHRAVLQAGNGLQGRTQPGPALLPHHARYAGGFQLSAAGKGAKIVVTNPNKIAATIDNNLRAIPKGTYPPSIPARKQELRDDTWKHAARDYAARCPTCCKAAEKGADSAATVTPFCTSLPCVWWLI